MDLNDLLPQPTILLGSTTEWPPAPGIISTGLDPQQATHQVDGKLVAAIGDALVFHLPSFAKYTTACFKNPAPS